VGDTVGFAKTPKVTVEELKAKTSILQGGIAGATIPRNKLVAGHMAKLAAAMRQAGEINSVRATLRPLRPATTDAGATPWTVKRRRILSAGSQPDPKSSVGTPKNVPRMMSGANRQQKERVPSTCGPVPVRFASGPSQYLGMERAALWENETMEPPKITKLPPGKALGADDLQNWSRRRIVGKSGVSEISERKQEKYLKKRAKRLQNRKSKQIQQFVKFV
jgi:hypothetical protein